MDQGPLSRRARARYTEYRYRSIAQHISIVDDDSSVRTALGRLVESDGYPVATFASAREFLDSGPPDRAACLVLDIDLPGMSGFELHERLVAARAAVPVIFITGHDDAGTRERAGRAGVAALSKPVEGQVLLDAIRAAVGPHERPEGGA